MTDSRAALDMDRLPWLADERKPRAKPRPKVGWAMIVPWALLAMLLVAGVSYWLGMRSVGEPDALPEPAPPAATVTLPRAIPEPSRDVELAPMPEVEPVAEPSPVTIAPPKPARSVKAEPGRRASERAVPKPVRKRSDAKPKPAVKAAPKLQYWPAIESTGASGRMVRIGTFSSRRQAKKGWWAIVRHYPGMRRMNAVVAPVPSLRNGRTFYRLQFGTTSQAHSEILCQRMRMIAQSCVVVGLQEARAQTRAAAQ